MICGSSAGIITTLCIYPLDNIKMRLSLTTRGFYEGISDCFHKTIRIEGIKGFYVGIKPTLMGVVPFAAIDLTVF